MGPPSIADEVGEHPDHRQIATFFLGWVFITAINNMATSTFLQNIAALVFSRSRRSSRENLEEIEHCDNGLDSPFKLTTDCPVLLFMLSLFFISASIAFFTSLLFFRSGAIPLCSFVVAWGGLSVQFARLVALILLLFTLRRSGIKRLETSAYLAWLLCGLGLEFANYAVGTGDLLPFPPPKGEKFLCYRQRNNNALPISLTASSMFSLLEVYVMARTLVLTQSYTQGQREWLGDIHVVRACSLLVFDLSTFVPSAFFTGILGEFIPFSIASVLVLGKSFQYGVATKLNCCIACFSRHQRPTERSSSFDCATPSSAFSQDLPFEKEDNPQQLTIIPMPPRISRFTMGAITRPLSPIPPLPMHPYSAQYSSNITMDGCRWSSGYDTARSSRTVDTRTARSIDEAVFEVAQRGRPLPIYREARRSVPPGPETPSISSSKFMGLSMEDLVAPLARPRLIVVPSSTSVDLDVKPDTPVSGARDSVAYDPLLKSRFSVSTGSMSLKTTSSMPSSPDRIRRTPTGRSVGSEWSSMSGEEVPAMPGRPMQFRAAGYLNLTQSRWPTLPNKSKACCNDSPQALPLPEKDGEQ
ncbi:hypothetical protein IW261DRAFT_1413459 [Armillaria novae-zelandiae]|uniref:Uncharacterized protein n=1 Tax=Armillaria novae-zelandiae TaxID=153914 RepID=A0AA39PXS3_9AGAR|nr:hypothetical protein IW261DRAFT_1413459 [Armillaria novae-zelandiae]